MTSQRIQFPEKLQFLFEPSRYKVAYGGRGGAKSWNFARALLIIGATKPTRVFCGRETQKSIANSVHKLLADQIKELQLSDVYEVLQATIRRRDGQSEFLFDGLKHNINNIKSLESVDIAWIEEAQSVSKNSWDVLIPTIRKAGSEIWVSFNPSLETDDTYQRFVVNPPNSAKVVKVDWRDNPWFPEVLRQEMEDLKERDHDAYMHVWEGFCKQILEGAVYADEMRKAMEDGRITRVPYQEGKPVSTFWDLGHADYTSIWFAQCIGHEFRLIDFYQNQFKKVAHYVQALQGKEYVYDRHVLPHDAAYETLSAERTTEQQIKAAYPNASVTVLPRYGVTTGIDAARTIFAQCWFDENKCADGLQALKHYRYERDEVTGLWSKNPKHDEHSHAADAFRYLAMSIKSHTAAVNYHDLYKNL